MLQQDLFQLYYLPDDYKEERDLSVNYEGKVESLKNILFNACDGDWENGIGGKTVQIE